MAKTIQVPSSVKQTGIIKDGTNKYGEVRWTAGTNQRAVFLLWKKCGSKHHKGIATIEGNYLVAVSGTFGSAGDGIVVHLKGGSDIPAVIADIKKEDGDGRYNKWGHVFGSSGTSVVEWEAYGVYQGINLGSWAGKKVKSITNLGKYKTSKGKLSASDDGSDSESGVSIYLKEAASHIGAGGKAWAKKTAPQFHEGAWCADFQCAVATATKFAGKIMSNKISTAGGFGESVVKDYGGTYIKGPGLGAGKVVPQPGDFMASTGTSGTRGGKYSAGHVGVVETVKGGTITSIDGNYSNTVARRSFSTTSKNVLWYARPDWDKVGGSEYNDGGSTSGGGGLLYDTLSTRADATIRDVCYADDEGLATKKKDVYRLNVLNYTSALFWIVYALGGTGEGEDGEGEEFTGDYDLSGVNNKIAKQVIAFLLDKGLSKAVVVGISANIWWESGGWDLGAISKDGNSSAGLCQWTFDRKTAMIKVAGKNWANNIEGQLKYLWIELNGREKSAFTAVKQVKNTKEGAVKATEIFCNKFERPSIPHLKERKDYARKLWGQIKVSEGTGEGDGKAVKGWSMPYSKGCTYKGNHYGDYGTKRSYETHPGIDLSNPTKPTILAINGGTVTYAGWYGGYGNFVRIEHGNGYTSEYGHGSKILVKKGQKVSKGQRIMITGSTGFSTGQHLHINVKKGGKLVSPRTVLPIPAYPKGAGWGTYTVK